MPLGKPADVPCVQLDEAMRCRLFGEPDRPAVCASLSPTPQMCGQNQGQAMVWLQQLESDTRPAQPGRA